MLFRSGKHQRVAAPLGLTPGRHEVGARFDRDGNSGTLTLVVDGEDRASVHIPKIMRILGSMGMDLGSDRLSPVCPDYVAPFPFTGGLEKVTFTIRSKPTRTDELAQMRAEAAKE